MRKSLICLGGLLLSGALGLAQQASLGSAEITTWPGIKYEVIRLQRIAGDRLLVGIKLVATDHAPKSGTLIGVKVPVPSGASPEDIQLGRYDPKPFSLATSKITEEKTGQEYAAVPPLATGPQYIPGEIITTLVPGRSEILTVQFPLPPPPVDASGAPSREKQTVSLFLPNAKDPIAKIPLPPAN